MILKIYKYLYFNVDFNKIKNLFDKYIMIDRKIYKILSRKKTISNKIKSHLTNRKQFFNDILECY